MESVCFYVFVINIKTSTHPQVQIHGNESSELGHIMMVMKVAN